MITIRGSIKRDDEAEWRKLKLEYYKEYFAALSGTIGSRSSSSNQARYADAVNNLSLIASPQVIVVLNEFTHYTSYKNRDQNFSADVHDAKLSKLIRAIRQDIRPSQNAGLDELIFRFLDTPPT